MSDGTQRIVVVESGHSVAYYFDELRRLLIEAGPDSYEAVADAWVEAATGSAIMSPETAAAYRTLAVESFEEFQRRREVL